jgi:hypothetical protein
MLKNVHMRTHVSIRDLPHALCSFGLSATSQQYFSLRTNQPLAISQQYFSLRTNQHQPSATRQTNRLMYMSELGGKKINASGEASKST